MVDRIFREYVFTLKTAGATRDVHDVTGIMQDIAPRKGFKVYGILWYCSTSVDPATDLSEIYFNAIKNISEAAHHQSPAADGEYTDVRVSGVILSDFWKFKGATELLSDQMRHQWLTKPIVFDANDRLNLELTFSNMDAASGQAIIRMFLDVEV
ncbi:unnamed protein product [marine sediment metagenome]|uniref:Uncharacterized protein n=1 Tax=marine sediment metagenome TaxID=412755 RepID=X1L534_9ZZZZ